MPVVKGGVWTNVEDEILKASVSKYGLNQWQRVSSLLARKSAKQCKARWSEWLDPSIRKVEWSRDEDEKLLHLAKLMPTQWRTIAPIVGRTATQCLDRYNSLLDEAEARDSHELGLAGPGDEAAPSADDIRKFRPGETDPDPETKPARPDAVDMDEDEKEMLSEARARLANTQGKKAKRKARERQLEDSRRLALLQKRRELKHAGINIKLTNRRKGEMDYNADIPFEKQPALGFYDTSEEAARNERQREGIDPRKALSHKRSGEQDDSNDKKRRKGDKEKTGSAAAMASVAKAGQLQKIREAEQLSKRRPLNLPQPQVSESELEEIVKMGLVGEQANRMAGSGENESTKGLVGNYTSMVHGGPIRTPRAPPTEDRVANEIKNIRALTETKSSLLGGENTPLHEGGTTGFKGINPERSTISTPNPMATPFRSGGMGPPGATPRVGQTPRMTPRDTLAINAAGESLVSMTPRDQKLHKNAIRNNLKAAFASLPAPKEIELEEPDEPEDPDASAADAAPEEDATERDRRHREAAEAAAAAEFKRRSQAVQRDLPRPKTIDVDALFAAPLSHEPAIAHEMALLIGNDALRFPVKGGKVTGTAPPLPRIEDEFLDAARAELMRELPAEVAAAANAEFAAAWHRVHDAAVVLPGLEDYGDDEAEHAKTTLTLMADAYNAISDDLSRNATQGNKLEKKLSLLLGGYINREKTLLAKIQEAAEAIRTTQIDLDSFRTLQISEADAIPRRLAALRGDAEFVEKRERAAQEVYRSTAEELAAMG
ncbi:pre-mRNA splicing factor component-domain-containing protein [Geopyxis carbonaria]|nr:pre-mRNA splicing factor component-domain-containing protein [Geopyxis carbonaria]